MHSAVVRILRILRILWILVNDDEEWSPKMEMEQDDEHSDALVDGWMAPMDPSIVYRLYATIGHEYPSILSC